MRERTTEKFDIPMEASVSEPLLSLPSSPHSHVGVLRTRQTLVAGVLGQLEALAIEQQSTARRIEQLQTIVRGRFILGANYRPLIDSLHHDCTIFGSNLCAAHNPRPFTSRSRVSTALDHNNEDALHQKNRQILELLKENEALHSRLDREHAEQELAAKYLAELKAERKRRLESEASGEKATEILVEQNLRLTEAKDVLQAQLTEAKADLEAWEIKARNVQDMQAVAVTAFERCNALEAENAALTQAMNTFAEGSTSATVQELQKIITNLTTELAQYKRREFDIKEKENTIRDKENHSIIRAMRKQTRELKRRSLQVRNTDFGIQENTAKSNATFTVKVSMTEDSALPAIPSFSELFLI
ncbi:hypothetical protein NM688_g369 [Phlebia brevispora]|uniref:Uncharacterized protein n=1 Tax=Phlebia brevispora TaxID=194682 RepID=A0ACC1TE93_9APHY|nr:hypothetical protein NM688_g369 [Phlebia brevispora]